jgi:hypothetical protein
MKTNSNNIRVINKEYERILTNPENVIVSDALRDIISSNFASYSPDQDLKNDHNHEIEDVSSSKNLTLTLTRLDESSVSASGDFNEFSFSSEKNEYKVVIDTFSLKQEFLSCLNSMNENFIEIEGLYNFSAFVQFVSWSITKVSSQILRFQLIFRSENVTI